MVVIVSIFNKSYGNDVYYQVYSYDFNKVDTMVKYIPKKMVSMDQVCDYINCHTANDIEKVRSIYMWIYFNIEYGYIFKTDKMTSTQLWEYLGNQGYYTFKYKRGICNNISNLFKDMSTLLGIKSKVVNGICKIDFTNGLLMEHAWNIVEINGTSVLVDATWGMVHNKEWFIVPPERFIFSHLPLKDIYCLDNMKVKCMKDPRMLVDGRQLIKYSLSHPEIYDTKNQLLETYLSVSWFVGNSGFTEYEPIKYNIITPYGKGGHHLSIALGSNVVVNCCEVSGTSTCF